MWLHKLLNPHCEHCVHEEEIRFERERESRYCHSCDTIRQLLESKTRENERLLELIISKNTEPVEPKIDTSEMKPVGNRFIPHRVRTQMLEQEDRKKAQILDKLEKEIGIVDQESDDKESNHAS